MNAAYITPQLITWARERAGMSVDQLARLIKVDSRNVVAWEKGQQWPPFSKAEVLAEKLYIPFGYLYLSDPPNDDFPLPDLRTVGSLAVSKPSPDFLDVVSNVLLQQQWYSEYLQKSGARKIPFIESCRIDDGFEEVAAIVGKTLGINEEARQNCQSWEAFLSLIVHNADEIGVLVMRRGIVANYSRRRLDVNEFRGFAIADQFAPLVFINSRDAKAAQNFTIVHELCHLWLGESGVSNPNLRSRSADETNAIERFCNKVAAQVLAPRVDLLRRWRASIGIEDNVAVLARYYRVSRYVVVRQAYEVDRITHQQYVNYLDEHPTFLKAAKTESDDSGGNFYNTFGARYGKRLISGVLSALGQNRITYREASTLLGVRIATVKKVAERFG